MPKNRFSRYKTTGSFLWKTIQPHKKYYITASAISLFLAVLGLLQARLSQLLIDHAVSGNVQMMVFSLICLVVLVVSSATLSYASGLCVSKLAAKSGFDLKCTVTDTLLHAHYKEILRLQAGDTLQTVNADTAAVCAFIGGDLIGLFSQFAMAIGALIYVLCVNPILAFVTFLYTPIGMFFTLTLNKKMNALYPVRADSEGRALSVVEQVLSHIPVIKSFMAEKQMRLKVVHAYQTVYHTDVQISKWNAPMQTACSSTSMVQRIFYLIFAGHLVANGMISVGIVLSIFDLLNFIIGPTVYMPFLLNGLNRSISSINRIARVTALPRADTSIRKTHAVLQSVPHIQLDQVSFSYADETPILSNISFKHSGAGIIALCGKSGSGKTTLLDLIAGLYQPDHGIIQVNGNISVVSQDTYIFDVTHKISSGTIKDFKADLCKHITCLPMRYHDTKETGELLSVASNDVECFKDFYNWNLCNILSSIVDGTGGVTLMAFIDWRFALVVFSLGTVSVYLSSHFSKKLESTSKTQQEQLAKTGMDAYELVRAAKTIRLFKLEENRKQRFSALAREESAIKTKSGRLSARMNSTISLVGALAYVVILFIGALFVHYGISDWGTVVALLALKGTTDRLFVECGQFMAGMQKNIAGMKRVFKIMDIAEETEGAPQKCSHALLEMNQVHFAYEASKPILQHFDLTVQPSTFMVLAGKSGSGKSTAMKLLLGLYTPDSGTIATQNGENPRALTAYVPQEPALFRGTVYENIALGNPAARESELIAAARLADADGFIQGLENGYQTVLLDNGASLSGGQRQRIAIARALVKNAPILLLDEITSALDFEAEQHVVQVVKRISLHKAVLFITHNPAIAQIADSVVVLN